MDKKQEDIGGVAQIDKTTVFQDARVFNQSPVSPRKCRVILTKLALLLFTGESWGRQEATTLFFGISKLFQNKDASLRQMVYLVIKELAGSADDVIMVTSSIMKDTSVGSDVVYRANAIRALCRVIDASTVQAIERLVKTCIVDKNPSVASAAQSPRTSSEDGSLRQPRPPPAPSLVDSSAASAVAPRQLCRPAQTT
jgi:coatomer protein complex subunit gamma